MKPDELEEQLLENKAKLRMMEVKLNALIKILSREGLLVESNIEEEVKNIVIE